MINRLLGWLGHLRDVYVLRIPASYVTRRYEREFQNILDGAPDHTCETCGGEMWVCENHPDKAWGEGDGCCGGAGMPCRICNPCDRDNPPKMSPGTTVICSNEHGWLPSRGGWRH